MGLYLHVTSLLILELHCTKFMWFVLITDMIVPLVRLKQSRRQMSTLSCAVRSELIVWMLIYRAPQVEVLYINAYFIIFFLFNRGQSLQQFLSLGKYSFLLLEIMRVPGVQRDMWTPWRAERSHSSWEQGANDRGWGPNGCADVVGRVCGFCGNLRRYVMGKCGGSILQMRHFFTL